MKYLILLNENLKIALRSIRANLVRTILTILIIAVGITSLVGILTATDALKASISKEFTRMGASTFRIENKTMRFHINRSKRKRIYFKNISFREAQRFKKIYDFPGYVSVFIHATHEATLRYKSEKTNPNIMIVGADQNFLPTNGRALSFGRNFTEHDIEKGLHVVITGQEIAEEFFREPRDAVGKTIRIGNGKYKIIGVLQERGTGFNMRGDRICLLPLTNVRQYFSRPGMSYKINVMAMDGKYLQAAAGEAHSVFRIVRKLDLDEEDNFDIIMSDSLANMMLDNIKYVTLAAILIGFITLLGASVGLMNIMLVSVNERTREIGTRKALGANSRDIKQQFLFEAIVICLFGGVLGIAAGIPMGNIVSVFTEGAFLVPWKWITGGVILCYLIGLASGMLPAVRAARLNPIEALRYE